MAEIRYNGQPGKGSMNKIRGISRHDVAYEVAYKPASKHLMRATKGGGGGGAIDPFYSTSS